MNCKIVKFNCLHTQEERASIILKVRPTLIFFETIVYENDSITGLFWKYPNAHNIAILEGIYFVTLLLFRICKVKKGRCLQLSIISTQSPHEVNISRSHSNIYHAASALVTSGCFLTFKLLFVENSTIPWMSV